MMSKSLQKIKLVAIFANKMKKYLEHVALESTSNPHIMTFVRMPILNGSGLKSKTIMHTS